MHLPQRETEPHQKPEPPAAHSSRLWFVRSQAQVRLGLHPPPPGLSASARGQASLPHRRELCLLTPRKPRKSPDGTFTEQMTRLIKRFGSQVASGCP